MLNGVDFPVTINLDALPNTRARARRKLAEDIKVLEAQGRMPYGNGQSGAFLETVMNAFPLRYDMERIKKRHRHEFLVAAKITVGHIGSEGGSVFIATRSIEFVKKNNLAQARRAAR